MRSLKQLPVHPIGNGYLAVYGWTSNPRAEWYIADSYGTYNPTDGGAKRGTVTCNGAHYDIVEVIRYGWDEVLRVFWSIRNPKKAPGGEISGTIDTGCHFDAWKAAGLKFGTDITYQIVATEGYASTGNATITVWSG